MGMGMMGGNQIILYLFLYSSPLLHFTLLTFALLCTVLFSILRMGMGVMGQQ
jgi:hypothetical protein